MAHAQAATHPYAAQEHDLVRTAFEVPPFLALARRLGRGRAILHLGCGDGLAPELRAIAGRFVGIDLDPPAGGEFVRHDLREGLGPVGRPAFDLYLGVFGIASHLAPAELDRLLREIARHARPGALVALEALGLQSLEWPRLWDLPTGAARTIPYRVGADVCVHPWAPRELRARFAAAGIRPLVTRDRTLQAGPKLGELRYWPGLPPLRPLLADLLRGAPRPLPEALLTAPLPPLPAGEPALVHQRLAARRRRLVQGLRGRDAELPAAIWGLETRSAGGYGHGLLVIGRVS
jgi:SAM-dependent methyltransferase